MCKLNKTNMSIHITINVIPSIGRKVHENVKHYMHIYIQHIFTINFTVYYKTLLTSSPQAMKLSWQHRYISISMMTYKPSELGQADPVFSL